jgi:hypothetical protein
MHLWKLLPLVALAAAACATTPTSTEAPQAAAVSSEPMKPLASRVSYSKDPYPSTYRALPAEDVFIRNATVFDGLGGMIERGAVLIQGGKISAIGSESAMTMPAGIKTIDAAGKWVTPGIIDVHSPLGVYPSPGVSGMSDGNEATGSNELLAILKKSNRVPNMFDCLK